MNENVYQAPEAAVLIKEIDEEFKIASTGQRLANLIIDYIGFYVFAFCVGVVIGLAGYGTQLSEMNDHLLGVILMVTYLIPQEALFGRTFGKLITKTKVVDMQNNKIGFGRAIGRTLGRFIPFEAFSFLGGRGRPRGIHDRISGTKVITLK